MRVLIRIAFILAGLLLLLVVLAGAVWVYYHPAYSPSIGLAYGQRNGKDLKIDVFQPRKTNGLAILIMASGSWKSPQAPFSPWITAPLLRRGYTLFAIHHQSQPEATVMEIFEDVQRGVRFVRANAPRYGVDPNRLGVTGGSSGGHLALLLATRGAPGSPQAPDPIDRESSAVQAVAVFYPVTDLLNLGVSTENPGDGGPPKSFVRAFGPNSTNLPAWKIIGHDLSPIYHVTTNLPPMLILHGDADTLVPLDQSQRFRDEAAKVGRPVELIVHPGGKHGWPSMVLDVRLFAKWFDAHLRP